MWGDPKELKLRYLWKLRSKTEIIKKLDTIYQDHQVVMTEKKVPMLKEWLEYENPFKSDPAVQRDKNKYSFDQLHYLTNM